jgi:hypothetical protein
MPYSSQRQHRWSELVPPQTALTFVAMYDPAEGLLTFSGASLLPSEPSTPPTPHTPTLDTPDTPTTFVPMPRTPAPSTLADMQSLLDAYFRSAGTTGNHALPARASSTFDGLLCVAPESESTKSGSWREKPLPVRPPPPPDRDSVFAWSWLGRMAQDDPREPLDAREADRGCVYWPSVGDSGYSSAGCDEAACDSDDDGDSFYFTPPEIEDPNEVRAPHLSVIPTFYSLHFLILATAVLCFFCDDNINIRIHRRAGSRMRLHLVRECTCLRLSCTWPGARTNSAIIPDVTSTSPSAPVAASPRAGLSSYDHGVTAAAGVEGCQHVREARSTRISR